jgi:Mn-containing catalase
LKSLGDPEQVLDVHPIPDSFPDAEENQEFNYAFMSTSTEREDDPETPWTSGDAPDGDGEFSFVNELDLDAPKMSVGKADAEVFNEPAPQDED